MSRLPVPFACGSLSLASTLDTAPGSTGLLIVSGGNEIRAGAFNGQARLAAEIAAAGFPVFRFDRRGVGDSNGENRGFRKIQKDIAAALAAFSALAPQVERVVGFGNCDAASALMLGRGCGCDALALSNPWTFDDNDGEADEMSGSAIRSRYSEKLKNPSEIARLLRGGVNLGKLWRGLRSAGKTAASNTLVGEMSAGITGFEGNVRFLVAERDRTGLAFLERWDEQDERVHRCDAATHAYVETEARDWLRAQLLAALREKPAN